MRRGGFNRAARAGAGVGGPQGRDPWSGGVPVPLRGPGFGTYAPEEVGWLLKDLSHLDLEPRGAVEEAEFFSWLPAEYQPDAAYRELFETVLRVGSARFALAVAVLTELVLAERGADSVLVSIARGGTPVGILMRRWAASARGHVLPHYAVSLVRGPGVDTGALDYLARHHDPADVVFVDGWTGKGAIAEELSTSLARYRAAGGAAFNDDLAVLADPGSCVRTYGTRDDFLLPSACLNSTATGLISRTVYSPSLTPPDGFHGAKFYRELAGDDASHRLLDTVSGAFSAIGDQVPPAVAALQDSDRTPTWAGRESAVRLCAQYGITDPNFVKPGVGETTRVLLRRPTWRVLVREPNASEHRHVRLLAQARGVPVEVLPGLAYACVGLLKASA
ncbi:cysteine protease StiP family protein [Streptomyces xanthochromogenes]|uniref:cysteine protease StiP family protein n=1 Tax=Streptomyces xanthochromogenes TaxID=67384 RepID=UPI0034187FB9